MPLILNTTTGNISPQFHCIYDGTFDTCKRNHCFNSLWQSNTQLGVPSSNSNPSTPSTVLNAAVVQHSLHHPIGLYHLPPHCEEPWDEPPPLDEHNSEDIEDDIDKPTTEENNDTSQSPALPIPPTPVSFPPLDTTRRSRSGRATKTASRFDESPHSSLHAYASTFSLSNDNTLHHILQPDLAAQAESHPLAYI